MSHVSREPESRDQGTSLPPGEPAIPLPRPLSSFIGRQRDIAAVRTLLERAEVRLVTLAGLGGVGKTRLALHVATTLTDDFERIWFVPLAGITDPSSAAPAIARGIGEAPGITLTAERTISHAQEGRRSLLVLDNFEHLLAASTQVTALLVTNPGLKILVTSRTALNISGEFVHQVLPLALPPAAALEDLDRLGDVEAVRLFVERAGAHASDFSLSTINAGTVAEICRRLGGLPLAIELAAARIPVLPAPAILARLDHSLGLLTGGPQDAPSRHRTMRDTIAWSHDLLGEAERTLFRRLGVFAGGFTLDAAAAVHRDSSWSILDGVSMLVACSLVMPARGPGDEPRFTMLEPVREYALELLAASGEEPAIRAAHARYFTAFAEAVIPEYDGPNLVATNDRVHADLDNARGALRWAFESGDRETALRLAGALWRTWFRPPEDDQRSWLDRLPEARDYLERALLGRDGLPVAVLTEALAGAGHMAFNDGDIERAQELGEELLARASVEHDTYGAYWGHSVLGVVYVTRKSMPIAQVHFEQALAIAPAIRNPDNQAGLTRTSLGYVSLSSGNIKEARDHFEAALAHGRICRNPVLLGWAALGLGRAAREQGNLAGAVDHFEESYRTYRSMREPSGMAAPLVSLSLVALGAGQPDQAQRLLSATLATERAIDDEDEFQLAIQRFANMAGNEALDVLRSTRPAFPLNNADAEFDQLRDRLRQESPCPHREVVHEGPLTPREMEVVRLLAQGLTNRTIAESLSISQRTVENHVLHILDKLELDSRTAAATWAVREGIA